MGRSAAVSASIHNEALSTASQRAGSPAKLAAAIGVGLHKVVEWIGGADVAPDLCPAIEQATGVKCDDLRPDLLWMRDGSGEILAFATPVDGADAAYVRQALAATPVEPIATGSRGKSASEALPNVFAHGPETKIADHSVSVSHEKTGCVHLALLGTAVRLDVYEAAALAGAVLEHRDEALKLLPDGVCEELADVPLPLLPLEITLESGVGTWKRTACASIGEDVAIHIPTAMDRNYYCQLHVRGEIVELTRKEADAIAYSLTNGNDGSGLAHVALLACADMSEAIKLLRGEGKQGIDAGTVANSLASKANLIRDIHFQWEQHTYRRYGNLRAGRAPATEAADRLGECARQAVSTIATVRGAMARGNWKDEHGNELTQRGLYADLRNVERELDIAAGKVMVQGHDEAAQGVWRNPLEATSLSSDGDHDSRASYMTNVSWKPSAEATVADCLEETSLTLAAAVKLILNNAYDESEDIMGILLGMARASVGTAHSKLIQFASEGRPS